jgi:DNA-binding transcriptional MerR regulator
MTIAEFHDATGVPIKTLHHWLARGVIATDFVSGPGRGFRRREFTERDITRARILQALARRVSYAQLANHPDIFDDAEYLIICDGEARPCQNAGQAIATAARAKRCRVVDLAAIRARGAE